MGDLTMAGLGRAAAVATAVGAARAGTPVLEKLAVCVVVVAATITATLYATGRMRNEPAGAPAYPTGVPVAEIESYCAEQHETRDYQGRAECIGGQINGYLWLLQHQVAGHAG